MKLWIWILAVGIILSMGIISVAELWPNPTAKGQTVEKISVACFPTRPPNYIQDF